MTRALYFAVSTVIATTFFLPYGVSQELTRSKAKEMLDKIPDRKATQFTVSGTQTVRGVGGPDIKNVRPCINDGNDVRIATGQLALCQGFVPPDVNWQHPGLLVTLNKQVSWNFGEVTGITGGQTPHEKTVEYLWNYDLSTLAKEAQEDLKQEAEPHPGTALFRLYDDGWRYIHN